MIGKRLGPYEITEQLGAGGMGEVYRAHDSRLRRDVAIKRLRPELTQSVEARRRFEREARSVARLSHPNVCTLYDVGEEAECSYLVMELLEGETLADRLARSRPAREQLLGWSTDIAAALAAAHARGIVHGDLKPHNVMLCPSGAKLLDFGLARFVQPETTALSQTLTATLDGANPTRLVGTVPYMAPEQIEGRPADAASDVFAFGAVLFEMFAGRRAFAGPSLPAIAQAILDQDPPSPEDFDAGTPPQLVSLIQRCLSKEPSGRWQAARDLEFLLRDPRFVSTDGTGSASRRRPIGPAWMPWLLCALILATTIGFALRGRERPGDRRSQPAVHLELLPPHDTEFTYFFEGDSFALSPDGEVLALICSRRGESTRFIALRRLDSPELQRVVGSEGASSLFWSRDGRSIGFFAGSTLKRVSLDGGAPVPICNVSEGGGKSASWNADGWILFAAVQGNAVYRVNASGGTPEVLIAAEREGAHWRVSYPSWLPDGDAFSYVAGLGVGEGTLMLFREGKAPVELMPCLSKAQWTAPDLCVFSRDAALFAQRFDMRSGQRIGGPFALADSVAFFLSTGSAQFATSASGTLVYQSSRDVSVLRWFDRSNRALGELGPPGAYLDIRFDDDGRTLWFSRARPGINTYDVWRMDLARQVESRVTSGVGSEFSPMPSPDGDRLYMAAARRGAPQVVGRLLAREEETLLAPSPGGFQVPASVSPDGRFLAFVERDETRDFRPLLVDLEDPGAAPRPLAAEGVGSRQLSFSPDGRQLALITDESGAMELYLAPFPALGPITRVSRHGARNARWSADGRELFYLTPGDGLMVVQLDAEGRLSSREPQQIVDAAQTREWSDFAVTPDAQRILAIVPWSRAGRAPLDIVLHWSAGR